jgi:hypothetical protein
MIIFAGLKVFSTSSRHVLAKIGPLFLVFVVENMAIIAECGVQDLEGQVAELDRRLGARHIDIDDDLPASEEVAIRIRVVSPEKRKSTRKDPQSKPRPTPIRTRGSRQHVEISSNGDERTMEMEIPERDIKSTHTKKGSNAPQRHRVIERDTLDCIDSDGDSRSERRQHNSVAIRPRGTSESSLGDISPASR